MINIKTEYLIMERYDFVNGSVVPISTHLEYRLAVEARMWRRLAVMGFAVGFLGSLIGWIGVCL